MVVAQGRAHDNACEESTPVLVLWHSQIWVEGNVLMLRLISYRCWLYMYLGVEMQCNVTATFLGNVISHQQHNKLPLQFTPIQQRWSCYAQLDRFQYQRQLVYRVL